MQSGVKTSSKPHTPTKETAELTSDTSATDKLTNASLSAPICPVEHKNTMDDRVLQLNMARSAAVTGEVRQLVSKKLIDILLLQEPYVRKQDASHTFYRLGTSFKVHVVRSQRPWAMVAISGPETQMLYVLQLSTTHCECAEVQTPGLSFYVASCYFQYSDKIEEHLNHLEKVLLTLKGNRLLVTIDSNARSSLWGPQEIDTKGPKLVDLISAYGMVVINNIGQGPTYRTARGASYIDVTLASPAMSQFLGEWKVRNNWTTSDHNSVDIRLRVPKAKSNDQEVGT